MNASAIAQSAATDDLRHRAAGVKTRDSPGPAVRIQPGQRRARRRRPHTAATRSGRWAAGGVGPCARQRRI